MHRSIVVAAAACSSRLPDPPRRPVHPPIEIRAGTAPADVAAGDLDGDGTTDLVTAEWKDRAVAIRLHRGGDWIAATPVAVELAPHMIALADVDGDLDLDLVVTDHDTGTVDLRLNDGAARFARAPGAPYTAFAVERPHNHGLVVGDVDGDHDTDVIVADQTHDAVAVLLADGRGGLVPQPPIALGAQAYPPAIGELDGDGRLDLVVPLVSSDAIGVLLGDGRGGFAHARASPFHTGRGRPYAIVLADLDRDGALDVAAPHDDTDEISVLLNDGRGGLRAAASSPASAGLRIARGAAADLDGDGLVDLVGVGSGSLVVLRGDGRGALAVHWREPSGGWKAIAPDLDGDGRPDPVVADAEAGVIRVWASRP